MLDYHFFILERPRKIPWATFAVHTAQHCAYSTLPEPQSRRTRQGFDLLGIDAKKRAGVGGDEGIEDAGRPSLIESNEVAQELR